MALDGMSQVLIFELAARARPNPLVVAYRSKSEQQQAAAMHDDDHDEINFTHACAISPRKPSRLKF